MLLPTASVCGIHLLPDEKDADVSAEVIAVARGFWGCFQMGVGRRGGGCMDASLLRIIPTCPMLFYEQIYRRVELDFIMLGIF